MGSLHSLHTRVGLYVGEGICRNTRVAEKPQDAVNDAGFGNAGIRDDQRPVAKAPDEFRKSPDRSGAKCDARRRFE